MDINRESGAHSLALCDKMHDQIEFWNGGLGEQQHPDCLVTQSNNGTWMLERW